MEVKLSVVIITYNEEKNIGRCLEAVCGLADDLVVVDSFSEDRTREICEGYGARFLERAFTGYVDQKNYANAQARFDHILSLDADEVLSRELYASVQAAKHNWAADGYYLTRLTNYCGHWVRHGGWYPDKKLRLFDRTKGRWEGLLLHERFELFPDHRPRQLRGDLLHYSYDSVKQHLDQINSFSDIACREMRMKGKKTNILQLIVKPPFRFFYGYFIRLGFLDGFTGFCIAVLSGYGAFVKYAKLYQSYKNDRLA